MRRRWVRPTLVIGALLVVWCAFAGRVLIAKTSPGVADVVFVLSGDFGYRIEAAVAEFKRSHATRIVVFLQRAAPAYQPFQDAKRYLNEQGIGDESLRLVLPVTSTADEAGKAAALVRKCGWKNVEVITSPYHTKRAGFLFRRALRGAARLRVLADAEKFRAWTWWAHSDDREFVIHEWIKGLNSIGYLFGRPRSSDPGVEC